MFASGVLKKVRLSAQTQVRKREKELNLSPISIQDIQDLTGFRFTDLDIQQFDKLTFISQLLDSAIEHECRKRSYKIYNPHRYHVLCNLRCKIQKKRAELKTLHALNE